MYSRFPGDFLPWVPVIPIIKAGDQHRMLLAKSSAHGLRPLQTCIQRKNILINYRTIQTEFLTALVLI